MKDLFDELRDCLPNDLAMKASKWEILSKCEYINMVLIGKNKKVPDYDTGGDLLIIWLFPSNSGRLHTEYEEAQRVDGTRT